MLGFEFLYPWLLLLFVPALLVTLIPHFRLRKRFRRTRNRIISLVLRLIVFVFAITLLSGMTITYTIPNTGNEIILLVDVTDSFDENPDKDIQEKKDNCITNIVYGVKNDFEGAKLGIVTYGYDQKYVAPLSEDIDEVHNLYLQTEDYPDRSATNLAAALKYAKGLFTDDATWKKIIVITDGKETDESANDVIRSIVSDQDGIMHVDMVDINTNYALSDAQIVGVEFPAYAIAEEQEFELTVKVQSNKAGQSLQLKLYDNGEVSSLNTEPTTIISNGTGDQQVVFKHVFNVGGLHKITVEMTDAGNFDYNNTYTTYCYIDIFDKVLIFESVAGDSDKLVEILESENATINGAYEVKVVNIVEASYDVLPKSVNDLRQYDQVIFNNISNANLAVADQTLYSGDYPDPQPEDPTVESYSGRMMSMIYSYVHDFGGGLFTAGGEDQEGEVNAYNRVDLKGSLYQSMLPVQVIDYTPPVGVVLVIDRSGSMSDEKLDAARAGAYACLDALTERDYVGVMTLDSDFSTIISLTSLVYKDKIREAIDSIRDNTGGTQYSQAIRRAGQALAALDNVAKRHIILVTDAAPGDKEEDYLPYIENNYAIHGTTISVVIVGSASATAMTKVKKICNAAGGSEEGSNYYIVTNPDLLPEQMRADVETPAIKQYEETEFHPTIASQLSPLTKGFDTLSDYPNKMLATLGGFYGTKLRKSDAIDLVLTGEYNVPIYAQWGFGAGRVGSFLADLKGTQDSWSEVFLGDKDGIQFILNVVGNLMPTESIRPKDLTFEFVEDNYTNKLTIFDSFAKGEYLKGTIYSPGTTEGEGDVVVMSLNDSVAADADLSTLAYYVTSNFTSEADVYNSLSCNFVFKMSGVYRIDIEKFNADGTSAGKKVSIYKTFSYSEEYDVYSEVGYMETLKQNMQNIASKGEGAYVIVSGEDFDTSVVLNAEDTIKKVYDPRLLFMILAIIFVLLDVAVRKFKFKWPHEIIREKRQNRV